MSYWVITKGSIYMTIQLVRDKNIYKLPKFTRKSCPSYFCWILYFSYVYLVLWIPQCTANEQRIIVTLHVHTSFAQSESMLSLIRINASRILYNKAPLLIYHLTEQELSFVWGLYENANIFILHIFRCNNNHLLITVFWGIKLKNKRFFYLRKNQCMWR